MAASVIGYSLLALLGLFLLVLLAPAVLVVKVQGGQLSANIRVLFVPVRLWPQRPKKEKPPRKAKKKKTEETQAAAAQPEAKKKRSVGEWLALIRRAADAAGWAARLALKTLWVYDVQFVWPIEGGDPAALAYLYGGAQSALGATRAVLANLLHIRYKKLVVVPDFAGEHKNELIFACKIAASPVIMVAVGLGALLRFANIGGIFRRSAALRRAKKRATKARKAREQAAQPAPAPQVNQATTPQ